eukprot:m.67736 g.67736  ORF g.67736 m.67736 type:complete len:347 (-) comp11912_c0_seq2:2290-3330(-)
MKPVKGDSVADCFKTVDEPTEIPDAVRRAQQKTSSQPGMRTILGNNVQVDAEKVFGITSDKDEGVHHLISPKPKSKLQEAIDNKLQTHVAIGQVRKGNSIPNSRQNDTFGIKSQYNDNAAECFQTQEFDPETTTKIEESYIKSHGSWAAGMQTKRNYTDKFNENDRFGKPTPSSLEGGSMRKAMEWVSDKKEERKTTIVPANMKDRASPRKLADPSRTYGSAPRKNGEEESVSALLSTIELEDAESTTHRKDSYATIENAELAKPVKLTEGGVGTVITPSKLTSRGVDDQEVTRMQSREELETVFNAGPFASKFSFEKLWESAKKEDSKTSWNELLQVMQQVGPEN